MHLFFIGFISNISNLAVCPYFLYIHVFFIFFLNLYSQLQIMLWFSHPQTDAPYAMVWLHRVSCGSSLFSSQEKFSFICSCRWAQMHSDTAKSKKGKCLFSKKDNSDSLDSKTRVLESRRCPRRSIKSPCTHVNIIIRKRQYLARWCRAYGSDGGSDQLCSCTLSLKAWYLLDDRLLCSACFSSWLQLFCSFSWHSQRYVCQWP